MKKAFITGAGGQDGSFLCDLLLKKGYAVLSGVRRNSNGIPPRLTDLAGGPNLTIREIDVTDISCLIRSIVEFGPDEIYNLAAQSHVQTSFDQPAYTSDVVYGGTLNMLEAMRLTKTSARLYQAGSSEMFGDSVDPDGFQRETTVMKPRSPYAIAKLAAHQAVGLYRSAYGVRGSNGILFNHESERRGPNFVTQKIAQYVAAYKKAEGNIPSLTLGNLDAMRDWGYAPDYVQAMHLMLQSEPDDYVIATGETHSVDDFLTAAFSCIGIPKHQIPCSIDPLLFRPCEVPHLKGDPAKAKRKLGWSSSTPFEVLVQKMVEAAIG
jgi:GDPmannose 4,6-dehydratase